MWKEYGLGLKIWRTLKRVSYFEAKADPISKNLLSGKVEQASSLLP